MSRSSNHSTIPAGLIDLMGRLRAQGKIPDNRKCVDDALRLAHQDGFPGVTRHQVRMAIKALKSDEARMADIAEQRVQQQRPARIPVLWV